MVSPSLTESIAGPDWEQRAALESSLVSSQLSLPLELTLWIDPSEVSCRFGENHGSYCTIASFSASAPAPVRTRFNSRYSPSHEPIGSGFFFFVEF